MSFSSQKYFSVNSILFKKYGEYLHAKECHKSVFSNKQACVNFRKTRVEEIISRSLSPTPGINKTKLKHLDRNVSHSKIISKMIELTTHGGAPDPGTVKLCNQAEAEHAYLNVYKSGGVDTKVKVFEGEVARAGGTADGTLGWWFFQDRGSITYTICISTIKNEKKYA